MGDKPAAVYCSDKRKPYMARTVSSKARSAGNLQRRTCDSALPVSAMYQGRQQAQMWAEIDEEGCNLRSSSDSHLQGPTSSSNAQPYLHAYTGGLAHTYGSRLRDQPRIAADLVNSMREGASSPRAPKVTSQIVAKSRLWPVAAAEGHLTVRRQASAYVPLLKGKSLPA